MDAKKVLIQAASTIGIAAMLVTPVFANGGKEHEHKDGGGFRLGAMLHLKQGWWSGWPKHEDEAVNAPVKTLDPACVKTAIGKRDDAIIAAWDTQSTAVHTALTARKTSLIAAWGVTDTGARFTALMNAWVAYRNSSRTARDTFQTTKKSAWSTFATDRKACGSELTGAEGTVGLDASL